MREQRRGRMPRLSESSPTYFYINFLGDEPAFIGLARYNKEDEKTTMTGIIFDRSLGKLPLPRIIRDETSDWSLVEVEDSEGVE